MKECKHDIAAIKRSQALAIEAPLNPGGRQIMQIERKIFDNAKERFGNDILKPEAYEKGGFWREMMDRHPSIAAGSRDVDPKARGKGPAIVMAIPFGKSKRAEAGRWRMERGRLVKTA